MTMKFDEASGYAFLVYFIMFNTSLRISSYVHKGTTVPFWWSWWTEWRRWGQRGCQERPQFRWWCRWPWDV